MCSLTHTHFLHLFLSDWGGQHALSVSTGTPLSADQKLWSRYDGEPLNHSAHKCIFYFSPFSSLCLFSSLFLQQGAGLVRSSSTISLRCTLPSCCFPLIKELLDKWLGRMASSAESNIFFSQPTVLHANDGQMVEGENHLWFAWRPWLPVITLQDSVCSIWNESSQMKMSACLKHTYGKAEPFCIRAVVNISLILLWNQIKCTNIFKFHIPCSCSNFWTLYEWKYAMSNVLWQNY